MDVSQMENWKEHVIIFNKEAKPCARISGDILAWRHGVKWPVDSWETAEATLIIQLN